MITTLDPIYDGTIPPGLYRFTSRAKADNILADITDHGWQGFHIVGRNIANKEAFLIAAAGAICLPPYFGHNWDAFEECITDMAWLPAPGYVLLYDQMVRFASAQPDEWATARAILEDAVAYWRERSVPFYVLMRGTWWHGRNFPNL